MQRKLGFIVCCGLYLSVTAMAWSANVALLKFRTYYACDIILASVVQSLADRGYQDGHQISITYFDAEGDLETLTRQAEEIVQGNFDLIITLSTPALQALAPANVETQIPHVFTFVTSPYILDIGVETDGSKPSYMTGNSNPNPVTAAFEMAKKMNPSLKKVGLVWNPEEANSAYQTEEARAICSTLGIELLEETVSATDQVAEAVQKVLGLSVQAIYMNGDNTVSSGISVLTSAARTAQIPVFIVGSGGTEQGTLFDLGPDYEKVGYHAGEMAASILDGENPAEIPVFEYITASLYLNLLALEDLKETWVITEEMKSQAEGIIGASHTGGWELFR